MYDGKVASSFFSHIYTRRSELVHGRAPEFAEISRIVAPLEQFVSDLIIASVLDAPEDG